MKTESDIAPLRAALDAERRAGKRIAFVPTMGNLHEGHLTLVRRARELADIVVVSIFVNPLQFGPNEDLDAYPRTLSADKEKLFAEGVNYLFLPEVEDIYPHGMQAQTTVSVPDLGETLCGASRPGHFDGVTTVVSKLFQIVQPQLAIFGEKDFQQLAIIRRMTADLCMPIDIVGVTTGRAEDGLALSSRNGYLSESERSIAPKLHQILQRCREQVAAGDTDFANLEFQAAASLREAGFVPDYFSICDADTLKAASPDTQNIVIAAAAFIGSTRLIDNVTLCPELVREHGTLAIN